MSLLWSQKTRQSSRRIRVTKKKKDLSQLTRIWMPYEVKANTTS